MPLYRILIFTFLLLSACAGPKPRRAASNPPNPTLPGWYADPEARFFNQNCWVFPTYSDKYERQVFFDAFSSSDLVSWTKHPHILDTAAVKWANRAMWAPSVTEKDGKYYFMWSEGGWTGPDYCVAYAVADTPLGPFKRIGKILQQDTNIATGAGHHSVIHMPHSDKWYIVYHRRPLGETDRNARQVCMERMYFDRAGTIKPVILTKSRL